MEFAPKTPSNESEPDDDDEKNGKKKKSPLRAPLPVAGEDSPKTETSLTSKGIGGAIIEGLRQKKATEAGSGGGKERPTDATATEIAAVQTENETGETPGTSPVSGVASGEAEASGNGDISDTEDESSYERLPSQELPLNGLSGGEVVLHLNGPVGEHVVPLQDESFGIKSKGANQEGGASVSVPETVPDSLDATPTPPYSAEVSPNSWFASMQGMESVPPKREESTRQQPVSAITNPVFSPESPDVLPASPYNEPTYPTGVVYDSLHERAATKKEVVDAVQSAKAQGVGQGLATGLLAGGVYEHFKHKRREKKREKQVEVHQKQLAEARKAYAAELGSREAERLQLTRENRAIQEQVKNIETRERVQIATAEKSVSPVATVEVPEQLVVPANHRIETSAWHAIEVDAKTGKAVENPTFQYGKEYYHERAQEIASVAPHASAAGEIALVAAAAQSSGAGQGSKTDSPVIPDASRRTTLPLGAPSGGRGAVQHPAGQGVSGGPLWVWLLVLVVIIGCIIAAL